MVNIDGEKLVFFSPFLSSLPSLYFYSTPPQVSSVSSAFFFFSLRSHPFLHTLTKAEKAAEHTTTKKKRFEKELKHLPP